MPEWTLENAAHLLRRTAFGGPPSRIRAFYERHDSVSSAVEDVLSFRPRRSKPPKRGGDNRFAIKRRQQAWWLQRMIKAKKPRDAMAEHMVLFWHGHLVSGADVQPSTAHMALQNGLFREYAGGNFVDLMRNLNRDAANLYYLDGILNRASDDGVHANPNENFGREIVELFTLGVNQIASDGSDDPSRPSYTEADVRGLARALTGWVELDSKSRGVWVETEWDGGRFDDDGDDLPDPMTIFGESRSDWRIDEAVAGAPNDVLGAIFSRRDDDDYNAVAMFMARKLWIWFAYPPPSPDMKLMLGEFADVFEASGFEMKPLLRAMLNHDEFYSQRAKTSTVRHPVDLVVSTARAFHAKVGRRDAESVARTVTGMGMDLFEPPNVAGWPGGRAWMTTANLLVRLAFGRDIADRDSSPLFVEMKNIEGLPLGDGFADPDVVLDAILNVLGLLDGPRAVSVSQRAVLRSFLTDEGSLATLDLSQTNTGDIAVRVRGTIALAVQSPFNQIV